MFILKFILFSLIEIGKALPEPNGLTVNISLLNKQIINLTIEVFPTFYCQRYYIMM